MMFFFILIGVIALCFMAVDLSVAFSLWQSRIHIGRWNDRNEWQKVVESKARQWLRHSPTVKVTDQNRLLLWNILRGRYRSKTIQSWQDAGLLMGLSCEDALAYVNRHKRLFSKKTLDVDYALLAYALKKKNILSCEDEEKMKQVFKPYIKSGRSVPYRPNMLDIRFVDTIGFICPFLFCVGLKEVALRQIEEYDKALFNGVYPPHAYNVKTNKPLGVFDWSRGVGWYILGLVETPHLNGNCERIKRLSGELLKCQRLEGGFSCMLFNKNERFESSGTALIGLLFVKAYEITADDVYLKAALSVERALMKNTRRDGTVDFAQGDTKGIGFYSRTFDRMPFAQGITLYLSKKLDRYEK